MQQLKAKQGICRVGNRLLIALYQLDILLKALISSLRSYLKVSTFCFRFEKKGLIAFLSLYQTL